MRKGKTVGLFHTWEECRESVHGYPGAEYKSFGTREEAEAYLSGSGLSGPREARPSGAQAAQPSAPRGVRSSGDCGEGASAKGAVPVPETNREAGASEKTGVSGEPGELTAYVDGSYCAGTGEFSYGMVLLWGDQELCLAERMEDLQLAQMHNVAGEIKGAEAAMRYALEHGFEKLAIYHDYEGISKWCLGQWKTNKEGTRAYKAFYDSISSRLKVRFVKVTGHSNDKYNDMADRLAKEALGIR